MISAIGLLLQASAKGSVVIAIVAALQWAIGRRASARFWYAIWAFILIRLLIPVSLPSSWSIFNMFPAHPGIQLQLRGVSGQLLYSSMRIELPWWTIRWRLLASIWISGVIVLVSRALIATLRMQRIVRRARPSAASVQEIAERERARLGIARRMVVMESERVDAPALHGLIASVLLLPDGLPESFSEEELRHVIVHELSHLRRHDIALNLIASAIRIVHWFNPLVWLAVERFEEERELACDELTLSSLSGNQRVPYGRTILKLLEQFQSPAPVPDLVGIVNPKEKMRRRLTLITATRTMPRVATAILSVVSAACLFALAADARDEPPASAQVREASAIETATRLDRRVTLNLTDVNAAELLDIVARKCDVAVKTSSPLPQTRFGVHATNVPAQTVLVAALRPMGLVPVPRGTSIDVIRAPSCLIRRGYPKKS